MVVQFVTKKTFLEKVFHCGIKRLKTLSGKILTDFLKVEFHLTTETIFGTLQKLISKSEQKFADFERTLFSLADKIALYIDPINNSIKKPFTRVKCSDSIQSVFVSVKIERFQKKSTSLPET